jgi:hypothetical protein
VLHSFVFVHGLNPSGRQDHAFHTWTYVKEEKRILWPKQFLSQDFPTARIWIFGYNSNVTTGVSQAKISDHANSLLYVLQWERQQGSGVSRDFLAHPPRMKMHDYGSPKWEF